MVGSETIDKFVDYEHGLSLRLEAEKILKIRIGLIRLQLNNPDRVSENIVYRSSMRTRALALMIKDGHFDNDYHAGNYFFALRTSRDLQCKKYLAGNSKRLKALKLSDKQSLSLRLLDLTCVT